MVEVMDAPAWRIGGEDDPPALQVGDAVQLVTVPGHVRGVAVGAVGTVLCVGLPFGACSVSFGQQPDSDQHRPPRYFQIRPAHLRRVAP